jgi:hypothetical protein
MTAHDMAALLLATLLHNQEQRGGPSRLHGRIEILDSRHAVLLLTGVLTPIGLMSKAFSVVEIDPEAR